MSRNERGPTNGRVLVAGWFSFEHAAAGAGDLLARDLVCEWLQLAGFAYDVALAPPFAGGVDYTSVDPANYSHVIFVCGPFFKSNLLQRFERCHRIGINVSMKEPVDSWNPFDLLLERDSSAVSHPDITFRSQASRVPVVGVALAGMSENVDKAASTYKIGNAAIQQLVASREMAAVSIDTRLDIRNTAGLRTPAEVESLIARMDVVLTTRLHGMVLALKNGVPAIAVDPVGRENKICRQAEAIGWPVVFTVDNMTADSLSNAFDYCLTNAARAKAIECCERALKGTEELRDTFLSAMQASRSGEEWRDGRMRGGWILRTPPSGSQVSVRSRARSYLSKLKPELIHR